MNRPRLLFLSAVMVGGVLALAGCAPGGSPFTDMQGEREAHDELPTLPDYVHEDFHADTSRYVGEHNGASLWLVEGSDPQAPTCLIVYPDPYTWHVACGSSGGLGASGAAGSFEVVPDNAAAPENGTKISENVYSVPARD